MGYLFTSESVSEGHPDKVADQISDAVLDELLAFDKDSKVACETMVTTGQVILAGEVKSSAYVDLQEIARRTIKRIGYTKAEYKFESESCGVLSAIHEQSADINRGVEREDPMNQGAGDQGNDVRLCYQRNGKLYAASFGLVSQDPSGVGRNTPRRQRNDLSSSRLKKPGHN